MQASLLMGSSKELLSNENREEKNHRPIITFHNTTHSISGSTQRSSNVTIFKRKKKELRQIIIR